MYDLETVTLSFGSEAELKVAESQGYIMMMEWKPAVFPWPWVKLCECERLCRWNYSFVFK